jgi:hypothetical protein
VPKSKIDLLTLEYLAAVETFRSLASIIDKTGIGTPEADKLQKEASTEMHRAQAAIILARSIL